MTTAEAPDVLVVGLGPARSRAAAAAAGYCDVIALERRMQPGNPVQCAEFVPAMTGRDVPEVQSVAWQAIKRMRTFVEGVSRQETTDFHGCMIDRGEFDRMLAKQAASAGARCRYGVSVMRIDPDGTVHTSDGAVLRARVLIGADGPHSTVGAAIGQVNQAMVDTRQVTVPLARTQDATDVFLSADYRGGYAWLFPKGAMANIGLGVEIGLRSGLKPMLDRLLDRLAARQEIEPGIACLTGGAIPVGGRLPSVGALGQTAVLLAGDAAGLTNPVTGAGIASAVQSGTLAGWAAAARLGGRADALADYEEELGDIFDGAFARALRRRRQVLARYEGGGRPDARALIDGWISSPSYWAA
jgi:geranylgeranyl reductase family protein